MRLETLNVVPANAGTHTPCRGDVRKRVAARVFFDH